MSVARRLQHRPQSACRQSRYLGGKYQHGRYKNWRERQAKVRYYQGEIKRVIREAREAGLLVGK